MYGVKDKHERSYYDRLD